MIIPLIGIILLIVWWCIEGEPGANRFGASPKSQAAGGYGQASYGGYPG